MGALPCGRPGSPAPAVDPHRPGDHPLPHLSTCRSPSPCHRHIAGPNTPPTPSGRPPASIPAPTLHCKKVRLLLFWSLAMARDQPLVACFPAEARRTKRPGVPFRPPDQRCPITRAGKETGPTGLRPCSARTESPRTTARPISYAFSSFTIGLPDGRRPAGRKALNPRIRPLLLRLHARPLDEGAAPFSGPLPATLC